MKFVDTHAHLYGKAFKDDLAEVITQAEEEGLEAFYLPNVDRESIDGMLETEERFASCHAMMGLHPCSVDKQFEKQLYEVESWLNRRHFAAVGEIGIDLYWDKTFLEQQKEAFRIQANWAKEKELPIIIHCRDSFAETLALVEEMHDERLSGIFHCFTGSFEDAKRCIALGFKLGIGGVATFKNGGLDKVLPHIDLEHLVLETDSPYLAPVPHRGKRNQPAYVPLVAQRVADLCEKPLEEVAELTTKNAYAVFASED